MAEKARIWFGACKVWGALVWDRGAACDNVQAGAWEVTCIELTTEPEETSKAQEQEDKELRVFKRVLGSIWSEKMGQNQTDGRTRPGQWIWYLREETA